MTDYHVKYGLPSFDNHVFVVFGYGSILWKQNFDFVREYQCFVKGYERLFYQGSRDHRGTPERPGRVVTLLPSADADARVFGKAYQLPSDPAAVDTIFSNLDVREQGGYERISVRLYDTASFLASGAETPLVVPPELNPHGHEVVYLCYNATAANDDYLGPADADDEDSNYAKMAAQIHECVGPSGPNKEYLINLGLALEAMHVTDAHVQRLVRAVTALDKK